MGVFVGPVSVGVAPRSKGRGDRTEDGRSGQGGGQVKDSRGGAVDEDVRVAIHEDDAGQVRSEGGGGEDLGRRDHGDGWGWGWGEGVGTKTSRKHSTKEANSRAVIQIDILVVTSMNEAASRPSGSPRNENLVMGLVGGGEGDVEVPPSAARAPWAPLSASRILMCP